MFNGIQDQWTKELRFYVNGNLKVVDKSQPQQTLLEYLRQEGLTGTKLGCGEGGCGACTVLVSSFNHETNAVEHRSVNACLAPVCSIDCCHVMTVEGIGASSVGKAPHPVQERIAKFHGSQCGFCTPGIVMSLYALLQNKPKPQLVDIENCFDGNLCRCTGYRPILDAAKTFAEDKASCPTVSCGSSNGISNGNGHCGNGKANGGCGSGSGATGVCSSVCEGKDIFSTSLAKVLDSGHLSKPYDPSTEKVIPAELAQCKPKNLKIEGHDVTWYRPISLDVLLQVKDQYPEAKLIAGNTEVGIETKFKNREYPIQISTASVEELQKLELGEDSLTIGGAVTLSQLEKFIHKLGPKCRGLEAMKAMIEWFASNQIRNVGTLAGNVCTASPISDLNPVLMALSACLVFHSKEGGARKVEIQNFFKGYRQVNMQAKEVLVAIIVPLMGEFEFVKSFKQARRRDDDISIVNSCYRVKLCPSEDSSAWKVQHILSGIGGMGPTTVPCKELEKALKGMEWNKQIVPHAINAIDKEMRLKGNTPGGMEAYRGCLAASFFYKFYLAVSEELAKEKEKRPELPSSPQIDAREASGAVNFVGSERPLTHGSQKYNVPSGGMQNTAVLGGKDHAESKQTKRAPVGQPIEHASSILQCTGEAMYVDDMPGNSDTLHCVLVFSMEQHAMIKSIELEAALAVKGVVKIFTAKDIPPENNILGPVLRDEEFFRSEKVTSTGQTVAAVVAETLEAARKASKLVKIIYGERLQPRISIAQAVNDSHHPVVHELSHGELENAIADGDVQCFKGAVRIGGQEHFYLECNAALAIPGEGDELTIWSSTQGLALAQRDAAALCGIPAHKVVTKTKRLGGGFGGKETRAFVSSFVALAAHRLRKPVKLNLDRDADMLTTGLRHPFAAIYSVYARKDGRIVGLDAKLMSNTGYSMDLGQSVMDRALFHVDNAYKIPNMQVNGTICLTNTMTNTAFRGFGGPQGQFIAEAYINRVAEGLKLPAEEVRRVNLYHEGDKTHFGQVIPRSILPRLFDECYSQSNFAERQKAVHEFNANNRWRKRGIALIPTKFGISFTALHMNQAGALVNIYLDGTVLVTHGGTEMGQGLHTKIVQVAASALGVEYKDVCITETATDKVPNASPTAASASSDMYGMAVLNACEQLVSRLAPYRTSDKTFKEAVRSAFMNRVNLSAQGFYTTPGITQYQWDMKVPKGECNSARGKPFTYFSFGAACSEVEIDCLTGDMRILRTDIVMDVGNSLNPTIDIGQIEGAFTQGFGYCTMEEVVYASDEFGTDFYERPWAKEGTLLTRGPGTYKIPSFNDVPIDFRITLLKDSENPTAIHSSRAVGEPPFFLGSSVYFAIRQAINSSREESGQAPQVDVVSPITSERIRMACGDHIATKFYPKDVEKDREGMVKLDGEHLDFRPAGPWC